MTSIGHSLTGLALGFTCLPSGVSRQYKVAHLVFFALLANVPDLPLPGWGHDRYDISHSIFSNAALIILCLVVGALTPRARSFIAGWSVALLGTAAWLSHLLLDSFYNHGRGIAVLWPLSDGRLVLTLPWFSTLHGWWALDSHTARVAAIELGFYGALLLIVVTARRLILRSRSASAQSVDSD